MHDLSSSTRRSVELSDLRSLRYAVVDVETTGTRLYGGDRIMEIAVVHVHDGEVSTAAEFLVNPQHAISPWVSRLTGITWQMVQEAPTFGDIAEQIQDAIAGHVFVAHNVRFDWRFLSMELRRTQRRGLRGERLCTVKLARRLLTHLPRRNLDSLAWHYEVPIVGRRHRAGPDARATADVLIRLVADARRQDVDTWDRLQTLLRTPRPAQTRSYLPQPVRDEAIA
jgi:DNA polymerase III epsilon subunit family exonuclease